MLQMLGSRQMLLSVEIDAGAGSGSQAHPTWWRQGPCARWSTRCACWSARCACCSARSPPAGLIHHLSRPAAPRLAQQSTQSCRCGLQRERKRGARVAQAATTHPRLRQQKKAALLASPLVSSSPTRPLGSQMTFCGTWENARASSWGWTVARCTCKFRVCPTA